MAMRVRSQISFEANDEAEAFRTARDRLGPDATILSQRIVKTGGFLGFFRRTVLQVTAGILETEENRSESDSEKKERLAAFQKLLEFKQAMAGAEEGVTTSEAGLLAGRKDLPAAGVYSPLSKPPAIVGRSVSEEPDRAEISAQGRALASEKKVPDQEYRTKLELEVSELSNRLDKVLKRLENEKGSSPALSISTQRNSFSEGLPICGLKGEKQDTDLLLRLMTAEDVSEEHARKLVREYESEAPPKDFSEWLAGRIPVAAETNWEALGGGRVMLIGPTGVGKTTTIAKLAAIQSLWEKKNVVLLTADTYRIAAPEQLRTYAKILCVPIDVVYDANEIPDIVDRYRKADLLLLDTAGRSQKDSRRVEEIRALYEAFRPDAVHLVLPANMKYRDMLDVIQRMGVVPLTNILFSKLDETTTYGALLNILLDFDKPVSFFTTGQNVPNDIEVARGARLVELLLRTKGDVPGA